VLATTTRFCAIILVTLAVITSIPFHYSRNFPHPVEIQLKIWTFAIPDAQTIRICIVEKEEGEFSSRPSSIWKNLACRSNQMRLITRNYNYPGILGAYYNSRAAALQTLCPHLPNVRYISTSTTISYSSRYLYSLSL
jgi:hypothetical protein